MDQPKFKVTKKYLDAHPELKEQGVKVGDEIEWPADVELPEIKEESESIEGPLTLDDLQDRGLYISKSEATKMLSFISQCSQHGSDDGEVIHF